jgi:hypothetical protein
LDADKEPVDLLAEQQETNEGSQKLWETEFSEEAAAALLASEPEGLQPEILE